MYTIHLFYYVYKGPTVSFWEGNTNVNQSGLFPKRHPLGTAVNRLRCVWIESSLQPGRRAWCELTCLSSNRTCLVSSILFLLTCLMATRFPCVQRDKLKNSEKLARNDFLFKWKKVTELQVSNNCVGVKKYNICLWDVVDYTENTLHHWFSKWGSGTPRGPSGSSKGSPAKW